VIQVSDEDTLMHIFPDPTNGGKAAGATSPVGSSAAAAGGAGAAAAGGKGEEKRGDTTKQGAD
jgi:hypothetical protein